jgi:hypothetical protein
MVMGMLSKARGRQTDSDADLQTKRRRRVVRRGGTMRALAKESRIRLR